MGKCGTVRQATDDNMIRRMRFACWITKVKNTNSEYVILSAFARKQLLFESARLNITFVCTLHFLHFVQKPQKFLSYDASF